VSFNNVNKAETIIYDEDTFKKEFGNNHGNSGLNNALIMKKTLVSNKDKEYYERQIAAFVSKQEKLLEESKKHLEKSIKLEEENKVY